MTSVVFIHWGDPTYLNLAVEQARKYNPVMVIQDPSDIIYSMEVDRWFILRDFMKDSGIERCVYLDSDVLLFKNVDDDFTKCDLAFSESHSGHTMFVNNYRALNDFCNYMVDNLSKDCSELVRRTRERLPNNVFADSIGDMVLLNNFMFDSNYFFEDTSKVINWGQYDHNINTDPFPIQFIYGVPYRHFISLNSVHFQGGAKERMKEWARTYLDL